MADPGNADIKKLTFERAIEELETIVKRLEEGKVPLEESVAIYERGEVLSAAARSCCARPRRGSRRSRWTPPTSRPGPSPWT
jgi:exodeoxyribonuclease VII small subunit